MLYISEIVSYKRYGKVGSPSNYFVGGSYVVTDTDDGISTSVSHNELADIIHNQGIRIRGARFIRESGHYCKDYVLQITVHNRDNEMSSAQVKALTLGGVAIRTVKTEIREVLIKDVKRSAPVVIQLSKFGTNLYKDAIKADGKKVDNVTFVLDTNITFDISSFVKCYSRGVKLDITALPDERAYEIYKGFLDTQPLGIIDNTTRGVVYKAVHNLMYGDTSLNLDAQAMSMLDSYMYSHYNHYISMFIGVKSLYHKHEIKKYFAGYGSSGRAMKSFIQQSGTLLIAFSEVIGRGGHIKPEVLSDQSKYETLRDAIVRSDVPGFLDEAVSGQAYRLSAFMNYMAVCPNASLQNRDIYLSLCIRWYYWLYNFFRTNQALFNVKL